MREGTGKIAKWLLMGGEARATAKATDYGSGLTQLLATADAGKSDQSDEALALNVVTQVCDELGMAYKVI